MKKIIALSAVISLFILGCSQDGDVISPVNNTSERALKFIPMPSPSGLQVNTSFSASAQVSGTSGGSVSLYGSYAGGVHGMVTVSATVTIFPGAFSGSKLITVTTDDANAASYFSPASAFSVPASYDLVFTGLNLSQMNTSTIQFVYQKSDGSLETVNFSGLNVDISTGTIAVWGAELHVIDSDSRYGFAIE